MLEFFRYFFGQGKEVEFKHFSFAHILPILIMGGIIALLAIYGKKIKNWKCEGRIRFALAFTAIITEMSYYWRLVGVEALETTAVDHLPITICGWAIIFCSFLAVTKNQTLFDIAYFWALSGSIFALLTPTVITYCGPTRFRYYQFWLEHTLSYIIIFYMIFVHNMRPKLKSMIKSLIPLVILATIAIIANNLLPGANYLYIAKPEDTASILDILPKNDILRMLLMAFVVSTLFFVSYLPWLILDIKRKKQNLPPVFADNEPVIVTNVNSEAGTVQSIEKKESKVKKKSTTTTKKQPTKKEKKME